MSTEVCKSEIEEEDIIEEKLVGQHWNNNPLYIAKCSADLAQWWKRFLLKSSEGQGGTSED